MKNKLLEFNTLFFILMVFIVTGCHNTPDGAKTQSLADTTKPETKIDTKKSNPEVSCDTNIVAQEFSDDPLAFKVFKADTNKIKSLFLDPVTIKMERQTNDQGGVYHLYNFTDGVNKISLYNNDGGFYIEDAEIKNDRVLLNKKISIGMKKDVFLELLKVKNINCNTITAVNDESTFASSYLFKDAKLLQIKIGPVLE